MTSPGPSTEANDRFVALFAAAPIGIALTDTDGVIVEANAAFGSMLGVTPEHLRGKELAGLAASEHHSRILRTLLTGTAGNVEVLLEHAEEDSIPTKVTLTSVQAGTGTEHYPIVMIEDQSELRSLGERLRHQNVHDALTGLPNAGFFHGHLEKAVAHSPAKDIALIYLDVDGFRVINDGLGSEIGDRVLCAVAGKLRAAFTEHNAVVARLTGDGFGVLLHGSFDTETVVDMVENTLSELHEPVYVDGHGIGVSASAGIVVDHAGATTAGELRQAAEITLHRAKEAGRAKWMLYDADEVAKNRDHLRMVAVIGGALENGEFELVYQPTVKLDGSGALPVVNATLRWNNPDAGLLDSEQFLPQADTTGMSLQLGKWLIEQSLSASARWRKATEGPVPDLCVRLPTRVAIDDDLVGLVRNELRRHDVPADSLRLCADSTTVLDPRGEVLESLAVLRELGVQLVLAVSASADLELIHRHQLPVGYAVMTGRIVDALLDPTSENPATIRHLEHLIESAQALGLRIGAEGVRTEEQASRLAELGVIAARGSFFCDLVSADHIERLITRGADADTDHR